MEDMDEDAEPVMDIDGPDAKNPLAVVEYVDELYAYYRRMEVLQYSLCSWSQKLPIKIGKCIKKIRQCLWFLFFEKYYYFLKMCCVLFFVFYNKNNLIKQKPNDK